MYYSLDENSTPAPGTETKANGLTFEQWKAKRDAKEAKAGYSRKRQQQSAVAERLEVKDRQELKR